MASLLVSLLQISEMIPEPDIWRAAQVMIRRFGADAATQAAMRADELAIEGDTVGCATWRRIMTAIEELQRERPKDGERMN